MIGLIRSSIEKYHHGVFVGFGIMTANGIFRYGCAFGKSVRDAIAQIDWRHTIDEAKKSPEQVVFWKKN